VAAKEAFTSALKKRVERADAARAAAEANLEAERTRSAALQSEMARMRALVASSGSTALPAQVALRVEVSSGVSAATEVASRLWAAELLSLESAHAQLSAEQQMLLHGVKAAMSCLPPPVPPAAPPAVPPRDPDGVACSAPAPLVQGEGVDAPQGAEGGSASASALTSPAACGCWGTSSSTAAPSPFAVMRQVAERLTSSARQAAHANARLGHVMASEREAHKTAVAQATRRLSYLAADVNARLLFAAQPSRHSPGGGAAFGALMLNPNGGALPTHWLSQESINSLGRWCDDEGVPLGAVQYVVGRVVHVSEPTTVPLNQPPVSGGGLCASNPFNLDPGETYFVVHAEVMWQHRWVDVSGQR